MKAVSPASLTPARFETIKALLGTTIFSDAELHPLAGDASFRRYIRILKAGHSAMLMDAPPEKEDVRPFLTIAQHIYEQGYSAPRILARNVAEGLLLLEDFGDDSFTAVLKHDNALELPLYEAAIDVLVGWHDKKQAFATSDALAIPHYNQDLLMKEISLFTDWFLPQTMPDDKAKALSDAYMALWHDLLAKTSLAQNVFVHRDYHADNLMWLPRREGVKRVGLLDFQDGVYGDPAYDLVSLLEDARRDVPPAVAQHMVTRYIAASGVDAEQLRLSYAVLGAQRNSKIIGIFARLAARDHKLHYLQYLPRVWRHLEQNLSHPLLQPLKQWVDYYIPKEQRGILTIATHAHAS